MIEKPNNCYQIIVCIEYSRIQVEYSCRRAYSLTYKMATFIAKKGLFNTFYLELVPNFISLNLQGAKMPEGRNDLVHLFRSCHYMEVSVSLS